MKAPVIITGFPRSGTTLVRAIFGAHPEIDLQHESELLHAILRTGCGVEAAFPRETRDDLLAAMRTFAMTRRHLDALPETVVARFLDAEGDLGVAEVYEHLLPRPDRTCAWGEKSLAAVSWVDEILELYPESFVLAVVRDPRSAVRSKLVKDRAQRAGLKTTVAESEPLRPLQEWSACLRLAMSWQDAATIVAADSARHSEERFQIARFEDVVGDAKAFVDDVCARIGLDPDPVMLEPASRADDMVLSRPGAFGHGRVSDAIDPSRATPFTDLHPVLTRIIEAHAAEGMRRFGYEPLRPRRSPLDTVRFAARILKSRPRLVRAREEDRANRFPGWRFDPRV